MNFDTLREFGETELVQFGGTEITPTKIGTFLIVVGVVVLVSRLLQRAIMRAVHRRGVAHEGSVLVALRLLHYVVLLTGTGVALQMVGVRLSALFAAGAIVAVGVGFAMQTIVQNFVSGVILLLERSIKPGDILEFDGELVKVGDMGIRRTIVRTLFEEDIILPNSELVQGRVKNLTLGDHRYRLHVPVGVAYSSDLDKTKEVLEAAVTKVKGALTTPAPIALLTEFAASAVTFDVSIWINNPWASRRIRSDLLFAVWNALAENDIVIAFDQLDVHLDVARLEEVIAAAQRPTEAPEHGPRAD